MAEHAASAAASVSTGDSSLASVSSPKVIVRPVPVVAANRMPPSWTRTAFRSLLITPSIGVAAPPATPAAPQDRGTPAGSASNSRRDSAVEKAVVRWWLSRKTRYEPITTGHGSLGQIHGDGSMKSAPAAAATVRSATVRATANDFDDGVAQARTSSRCLDRQTGGSTFERGVSPIRTTSSADASSRRRLREIAAFHRSGRWATVGSDPPSTIVYVRDMAITTSDGWSAAIVAKTASRHVSHST